MCLFWKNKQTKWDILDEMFFLSTGERIPVAKLLLTGELIKITTRKSNKSEKNMATLPIFIFSGHTPTFSDVFLRYDKQLSLKIINNKISWFFFSVQQKNIHKRNSYRKWKCHPQVTYESICSLHISISIWNKGVNILKF